MKERKSWNKKKRKKTLENSNSKSNYTETTLISIRIKCLQSKEDHVVNERTGADKPASLL